MNMLKKLRGQAGALQEPADYYHGRCLPENLVLPDSILLFYSMWSVTASQAHARYLLVIPFCPVVYYVEEARYELQPGNALFITPWQRHCHQANARAVLTDRLLITFELSAPQGYLPQTPLLKLSDKAENCVKTLLESYETSDALALSYQLVRLLSELADHPVQETPLKLSAVIATVLRYISQHIDQPLDIQMIADETKLSPSHLRMLFRKEMGGSLGRYIAEQRLNLACSKLVNSNSQVQEIASCCGYASIYAFGHFFKNITGLSPLQFRKRGQIAPHRERIPEYIMDEDQ